MSEVGLFDVVALLEDVPEYHLRRGEVDTAVVSTPLRYMHTMVESVTRKHIERTSRLDGETVDKLTKTLSET